MVTYIQKALIIHDASKQLTICLRNLVTKLSLKYGDRIKLLVITEAFTDKHRSHAQKCGLIRSKKSFQLLTHWFDLLDCNNYNS